MRLLALILLSATAAAQQLPPATIYQDSTRIGIAGKLKFTGAGVTCAGPSGGFITCTITSGGGGGSGTVTSVAAGTGMSFPTITASGTVAVDTTVVATTSNTLTMTNKTLTSPVFGGTSSGTYTLGGTLTLSAPILSGSITGTYTLGGTPTITTPVVASGLTASGSTSNDFSGSSGTFKTSTGAHTIGSATIGVPANTVITGSSSATNTTGVTLTTNTTDGASSIGAYINNTADLANTSAKLLSVASAGTESMSIRKGGYLWGTGGGSANLRLSDAAGTYLFYGNNSVQVNGAIVGVTFGVGGASIAHVDSTAIYPQTDLTGASLGKAASRFSAVWAKFHATNLGSNIASAATIAPIAGMTHITGTAAISTITVPSSLVGCVKLIPDGAFTLTTGGNIAVATTAVVSKIMDVCFDGTSWYPSY